jgi:ankyrin repeat protein
MHKKIVIILLFLILNQLKCFAGLSAAKDSFDIKISIEQKIAAAIEKGSKAKVSDYIHSLWGINRRFVGGSTFLVEAIRYKQTEIIEFLLKSGADPNLRTTSFKDVNDNWIPEDSPLEMAIVFDSAYSTAELLLKHGANINDTDIFYGTVLHEVITGKGDMTISRRYTENEKDTNKFKMNQDTALKKVLWLIKNGANVNAKNSFGDPPLYNAVSFGYFNIAEVLIDNGAAVNIAGNTGKGLLHLTESPELTLKLIKKGADVNASTNDGLTPLHFAIFSENFEKVKILVENNADVNLADYDSHLTPLGWLIVDNYSYDIAKLLISHGAKIPEDLVEKYGWKEQFEKIKNELKR